MGQRLAIQNVKIAAEHEIIPNGYLIFEDEVILKVGHGEPNISCDKVITAPSGSVLLPGMIDIHIHGGYGADTMDATPDALQTISKHLPSEGTTSFLATTITQEHSRIEDALRNAAHWMNGQQNHTGAEMLGIHLEGPFINKNKAGAQPENHIIPPNLETFINWQKLSENRIKIVTFAPEEDTSHTFVKYLTSQNIIPSIGHSDANYNQMNEAIASGAKHVTHLFNGMRGFHHREPGVAGTALAREDLFAELITDGIHSHEAAVKLTYQAKGSSGIIMITDSMRGKGLSDGRYDFGGQTVEVKGDTAFLSDGTLAGSILKMNEGAKLMMKITNCSLLDIVRMTSSNAANQLNVYDRKGSLTAGKDADLVIVSPEGDVLKTYCKGKIVWERTEEL
ncbi:N-acetylglucosamine-6-phosphate deacetylase [Bacillus gobiensis]|uniref:N-acetylglucosamine-6-phosphate deacetylase n=1 Tax=Bacillus gobiensis TaxID=1441095 RepID=UPI003D244D47